MLIANARDKSPHGRTSTERMACSKFEQVIKEAAFSAQALTCHYYEGHLMIRGTVSSYRQKQAAQEAVRQLPGVNEIVNQLKVVAP